MRYSLLDFLCCPETGEDFVLLVFKEVAAALDPRYLNAARRVNAAGSVVGPLPEGFPTTTPFARLLAGLTPQVAADPVRNLEVDVSEGMLVSVGSGRWYPVVDGLPELLPDHLRDWKRDLAFLEAAREHVPPPVHAALYRGGDAIAPTGAGERYKIAEIELLGKVEKLDDFLGPGYVAPFYIGDYHHAKDLIRGFANAIPLLALAEGKVMLDSGCDYAWTTEWLMKIGVTAIGIDINRTYMDVGRKRMGGLQPHLLVGDVENLPLKNKCLDAVLGFDAFHHVPDRPAAMRGFYDKLADGGRVVFVEPGADHQDAPGSIDVMRKYGTLEHGMDFEDVCEYVEGTPFYPPEEYFLNLISNRTAAQTYTREQLFDRSFVGWRMFVIEKPGAGGTKPWAGAVRGLRAWAKRQPAIYWIYRKLRRWFQ